MYAYLASDGGADGTAAAPVIRAEYGRSQADRNLRCVPLRYMTNDDLLIVSVKFQHGHSFPAGRCRRVSWSPGR
jgi:hypothetical protein